MRVRLILSSLALFICDCSTNSNSCEQAGGKCQGNTPGTCLNLVVGNNLGYTCDTSDSICCLPLSYTSCEKAGGKCVLQGTCTSGTLGDTNRYRCEANGGLYDCCMPSADAGG